MHQNALNVCVKRMWQHGLEELYAFQYRPRSWFEGCIRCRCPSSDVINSAFLTRNLAAWGFLSFKLLFLERMRNAISLTGHSMRITIGDGLNIFHFCKTKCCLSNQLQIFCVLLRVWHFLQALCSAEILALVWFSSTQENVVILYQYLHINIT